MSNPNQPPAHASECAAALSATDCTDLPDRLGALAARFEGRPYLAFTLVGGPDAEEELVTRLDGFDCVTFAESVFALAHCDRPEDYPSRLAELRYLDGRVRWADRNHYMNRWIDRNTVARRVVPVLPQHWVRTGETRSLSALPGYPAQEWPVTYLPSSELTLLAHHAEMGDLVGFVSNRSDLDTFHVGLLVPGDPLCVRHAGRSAGQVLLEPLAEFLDRNDVPGMLLARLRPLPTA